MTLELFPTVVVWVAGAGVVSFLLGYEIGAAIGYSEGIRANLGVSEEPTDG